MKLSKNINILIVGLGLLGGSYAKALTKQGYNVSAIARRRETIDYALKNGIISRGTDVVEPELVSNADLVDFALYPHIFI